MLLPFIHSWGPADGGNRGWGCFMRMWAWGWLVGVVLLVIPFLLLVAGYDALPPTVSLLRGWDGQAQFVAAKSPVTVLRVPAIGVLSAAAAALMARYRPSDTQSTRAVDQFWLALFLAACLKSACEGAELAVGVVSEETRAWAGRGAIAAVIVGLVMAAAQLPSAWPEFRRRAYWRLTATEKAILVCLGVGYFGFALVPILVAKWGSG